MKPPEHHRTETDAGRPRFRGAPVDLVVDVRSKLEFWTGHLPGAICIPVDALPRALARRADVTTDSRIVVYCGSGKRSAAAASELRDAGYAHVIDGGGMDAASQDYSPA
jgi:phage shock protein E